MDYEGDVGAVVWMATMALKLMCTMVLTTLLLIKQRHNHRRMRGGLQPCWWKRMIHAHLKLARWVMYFLRVLPSYIQVVIFQGCHPTQYDSCLCSFFSFCRKVKIDREMVKRLICLGNYFFHLDFWKAFGKFLSFRKSCNTKPLPTVWSSLLILCKY